MLPYWSQLCLPVKTFIVIMLINLILNFFTEMKVKKLVAIQFITVIVTFVMAWIGQRMCLTNNPGLAWVLLIIIPFVFGLIQYLWYPKSKK